MLAIYIGHTTALDRERLFPLSVCLSLTLLAVASSFAVIMCQ
jgi:hypothetical protein